jgi:superfamily I DNA/RNA helicase
MEFRIADTFVDSLARLTGEEQKAAKTTAFDLQLNPANPGFRFHRLDKARDRNFWSIRISGDLRLIVHRTAASLLLCYVHHHDQAYQWAERRMLETHPKTGAAQLVEVRETVQEIVVPKYVKPAPLASVPDSELLSCGVPPEWIPEVRKADEDSLLILAQHLPAEAAEALLDLATGVKPKFPPALVAGGDPFAHPDAQRRFRVIRNVEELERALEYPWDKWAVFLHPAQRQLVEREYSGPARVAGSAGTGKTIVALHRAAFLARKYPDARVLLTTFSKPLARALSGKLRRLLGNEPRLAERVEVYSMNAAARRLYRANFGGTDPKLATRAVIEELVAKAASSISDHKFTSRFLMTEWADVVDAWQIDSWESYRTVPRLGRRKRLPEAQRATLWQIFSAVRAELSARGLLTEAGLFSQLATRLAETGTSPFDFAVVDEAQDVSISQLRFLAALGQERPDALFLAGDLGQRIFQQPFSWKALGVDIRGRSTTLKINYRTSHQIRSQADRLLGPALNDVDGNVEERRGTTSVFNGPPPAIRAFGGIKAETDGVAGWLKERLDEDAVRPEEIGVFVRSAAELERAKESVSRAGLAVNVLEDNVEIVAGRVSVGTMHLAKGLEFRAVAVMACDDEVIPSQRRIEAAGEESDLEEVYNTERHLLYVACTRARDFLLVSGSAPVSEFLEDLAGKRIEGATAG